MIVDTKVHPKETKHLLLHPFTFSIIMDCEHAIDDEIEISMVYIGSSETDSYDQRISHDYVGPIPRGRVSFEIESDVLDITKLDLNCLFGLTSVVLLFKFKGKEFLRIGYFVKIGYPGVDMCALEEPEDFGADEIGESDADVKDNESDVKIDGDDSSTFIDKNFVDENEESIIIQEEEDEIDEDDLERNADENEESIINQEEDDLKSNTVDENEESIINQKDDIEINADYVKSNSVDENEEAIINQKEEEEINEDDLKSNTVDENEEAIINQEEEEEINAKYIKSNTVDENVKTIINQKEEELIKEDDRKSNTSSVLLSDENVDQIEADKQVNKNLTSSENNEINYLISENKNTSMFIDERTIKFKDHIIDIHKITIEFCEPPLESKTTIKWNDYVDEVIVEDINNKKDKNEEDLNDEGIYSNNEDSNDEGNDSNNEDINDEGDYGNNEDINDEGINDEGIYSNNEDLNDEGIYSNNEDLNDEGIYSNNEDSNDEANYSNNEDSNDEGNDSNNKDEVIEENKEIKLIEDKEFDNNENVNNKEDKNRDEQLKKRKIE